MSRLPAISEHRSLRLFMLFILYVGQGLPIGLFFYSIPAWLADNGASVGEVGSYSFIMALPWTLKFVNGFFLDRFSYLPMGRRRAWLLPALLLMVISLLVLALVNPSIEELSLLSAISFVLMFFTTYQDAAIDGMAADLVPDSEEEISTGAMFGGQLIGIALGSAVSGFLITHHGIRAAFFAICAMVFSIMISALITRERPGEKLLPWSAGEASKEAASFQPKDFRSIVRIVFREIISSESIKLISLMLLSAISFGVYTSVMPNLSKELAGWSTEQYSNLSGTANLISGFLCVVVLGNIARILGRKKFIITVLSIQLLLTIWALMNESTWGTDGFIRSAGYVLIIVKYSMSVATAAIALDLCNVKVSATQFTLYMAFGNLGLSVAYAFVGPIEDFGGYQALIASVGIVSFLGIMVATSLRAKQSTQVN